jgi:endonuclease YncB( thermonuclease family)
MWSRTIAAAGFALLLAVSAAHAGSTATVGVVTAVDGQAVQVTAGAGVTKVLRLDGQSQILKWITHQPWQQDTRADRAALTTGRCVQVESRDGDAQAARLIRVNLDDVASIWSPCRNIAASLR